MTAVVSKPETPPPADSTGSSRRTRLTGLAALRGRDLAWLTPAVVVGAVVQGTGMAGAPGSSDLEGAVTARAWALATLGQVPPNADLTGAPPLGWLQLAAYGRLTAAFDRDDTVLAAMREATLFFAIVSMVLLWLLARRVGLGRVGSSAAVVIFAVSPLAVQLHRIVSLDAVALPWLLGSLLLAGVHRHRFAASIASVACLLVAVLSQPTFLLAVPLVAWLLLHHTAPATRGRRVGRAAVGVVAIGVVVVASVGIVADLVGASGSPFEPATGSHVTIMTWLGLDPVLAVLGIVAAIVGLGIRVLRPYAALALAFCMLLLVPNGSEASSASAVLVLPFLAVAIAALGGRALRAVRSIAPLSLRHRVAANAWVAVSTVALVVAAPNWFVQLRGLFSDDLSTPTLQAEQWLTQTAPHSRMILDESMWADLVRDGFPPHSLISFSDLDGLPSGSTGFPADWRNVDYVVTTADDRLAPHEAESRSAIVDSVVVARFGSGSGEVDVRRVVPQGAAAAEATIARSTAARSNADRALAKNPDVTMLLASAGDLDSGAVDVRIVITLAALGQSAQIVVADTPAVFGETGPRRQAVLSSFAGRPLTPGSSAAAAVRTALESAAGGYRPQSVTQTADGLLVSWSLDPTS